MPLFCKSIHCFRPTFGKKSCKKHRCTTQGCNNPRHVGCATCFFHVTSQMQKNSFGNGVHIEPTNQIIFGGEAITINSFANNSTFDNSGLGISNNTSFGNSGFGNNSVTFTFDNF